MQRTDYLNAVRLFHKSNRPLPDAPVGSTVRSERVSVEPPEAARCPVWFDELANLCDEVDVVSNVIVHGSYGDGTNIEYSDLDLTLYVDNGQLGTVQNCHDLNRWINRRLFPFLVSIDSQQHHGPFMLWAGFERAYSERVLPTSAYEPQRAWSVKTQTLEFQTVLDQAKTAESLACAERIAAADRTFFRHGFDSYSMKRLVSNASLLPAYFLGDIGRPTDKAASFAVFADLMGGMPKLVSEATRIRSEWQPSHWHQRLTWRFSSRPNAYRAVQALDRGRHLRDDAGLLCKYARDLIPRLRLELDAHS